MRASSSATSTSAAASKTSAAAKSTTGSGGSKSKLSPRTSTGATPSSGEPTIADYIQKNGIQETPIHRGDPGSPTIDLPVPDGWEIAGDATPEWAYGAIVYTGPESGSYTPSIIALVSKLEGDVDAQQIIDLAGGELKNLSGYKPLGDGQVSTLSDFPAYQLGGTWVDGGDTKIVAQKTVVVPGADGLYVVQLNADGAEDQIDIVSAATDVIDEQTKITP